MVTDILWKDKLENQNEYKQILLGIETIRTPFSRSGCQPFERGKNVEQVEIDSFESITGKGVKAQTENGSTYYVGNHKLMLEKKYSNRHFFNANSRTFGRPSKTVIFFGNEKQVLAILTIADKIKETSKGNRDLQERGIEVYMLTGDNKNRICYRKTSWNNKLQGEAMPSDKAAFVEKLHADGKTVAMVGDGINDSHALAQANVSIVQWIKVGHSDGCREDDIDNVRFAIYPKHWNCQKEPYWASVRICFGHFIYNIIGIPIAAGVLYPVNGFY